MNNFGLSGDDMLKIKNIFTQYPKIEEVIIFGSRAKGNYRDNSDIDFAIKSSENMDLTMLQEIEINLEELYLPYFIDLLNYNTIHNSEIISHINRVGKIFYKKP